IGPAAASCCGRYGAWRRECAGYIRARLGWMSCCFRNWAKALEIRTQGQLADGRPALDEIVARGASVHLEQMAHDHWWMGLEAGGKYFHLNFGVQGGRLWVRLSDQGEEGAEWEGDCRDRPKLGGDD